MIDISKYRALSADIWDVEETKPHELTIVLGNDANVNSIIKKVNFIATSDLQNKEVLSIIFAYDNGRTIDI
ncbi:hypothetical protein [Pedobacter chinensis]|nr:hypothetical protein [Pedobacter chinensis]